MTGIVRYDKARASLQRGLEELVEKVRDIDVETEGVEFVVADLAATAQKARDIAKDREKRELEPYEPQVKEIKARWKDLIGNFDLLFKRLKTLGGDVIRRKREAQARLRREATRQLEMAKKAEAAAKKKATPKKAEIVHQKVEQAKQALEELPPEGAPIGVKTDDTTLHERKVWKWKLIDIKKVPATYTQTYVEGKKIDLAVKNGKRKIAGIEIFEAVEMVSRRAK